MGRTVPARSALAIIGAGPIGLETAARAVLNNWDVVLFEKATVGHHIRQWGHVRLFSLFALNHSTWGPRILHECSPATNLPHESAYLTGLEYIENYLEPLARVPAISERLFLETEVAQIGKERISKKDSIGEVRRSKHPFRLLLRSGGLEFVHHADAVIDASGVYSSPRFLGSGNIPAVGELDARREAADHLHYGIVDLFGKDRRKFAGRRTLLIGAGHSAATALEAFDRLLEEATETRVFWLNRSEKKAPYEIFKNDPLPYRDRLSKLANRLAASPPSWLECLPEAGVQEIRVRPRHGRPTFEVWVESRAEPHALEVDEVIAATGFIPDNSIYRQLQVHECYATAGPIQLAASLVGGSADCLAPRNQGIDLLKNPEPNFFILGNKSYGTNSTFLLSHGIAQVATVMNYLEVHRAEKSNGPL